MVTHATVYGTVPPLPSRRRNADHVHLVCRSCGKITEVSPEAVRPLVTALDAEQDFETDVGHLTVSPLREMPPGRLSRILSDHRWPASRRARTVSAEEPDTGVAAHYGIRTARAARDDPRRRAVDRSHRWGVVRISGPVRLSGCTA